MAGLVYSRLCFVIGWVIIVYGCYVNSTVWLVSLLAVAIACGV